MAILDYQLQFSDAQAITVTAASTNVIDCGVADANLGGGQPVWCIVEVNTAFEGDYTLTVSLQDCSTESGTYYDLSATQAYALAALAKGSRLIAIPLPAEHERYLRIYYTASNTFTAGAVDAYLTIGPQLQPASDV